MTWNLFEDYGDNFYMIFVGILLLLDFLNFFWKECLFSAENLSQKGF